MNTTYRFTVSPEMLEVLDQIDRLGPESREALIDHTAEAGVLIELEERSAGTGHTIVTCNPSEGLLERLAAVRAS